MRTSNFSDIKLRRAELMAELLFQELDPVFLYRTTQDAGYDLLVAFPNERSGINTFAVQVVARERVKSSAFPMPAAAFKLLAHSNIPGLLIVADVKENRLFFSWLKPQNGKVVKGTVPVHLTEIDKKNKKVFQKQLVNATAA